MKNFFLINIFLFAIISIEVTFAISYTAHEHRFYQAQAKFIKSNWKKIIKNESVPLVNIDQLLDSVEDLDKKTELFINCRKSKNCSESLSKLSSTFEKIEGDTFLILSKLGGIKLSVIEKNRNRYPLFIKKISDLNHLLYKARTSINSFYISVEESMNSRFSPPFENIIPDLRTLSENISFQAKSVPQIMMNKNVKELLILGENEFVRHLSGSINDIPIEKYHQLDKIFNVMNRDLQKNTGLISPSSKNTLVQIHSRWNAILKIVKRK